MVLNRVQFFCLPKLPAEGEARNAIYAAKKGGKVYAFDFSPIAQQKALLRSRQRKGTHQFTR